jgi:hypothetical protein
MDNKKAKTKDDLPRRAEPAIFIMAKKGETMFGPTMGVLF